MVGSRKTSRIVAAAHLEVREAYNTKSVTHP